MSKQPEPIYQRAIEALNNRYAYIEDNLDSLKRASPLIKYDGKGFPKLTLEGVEAEMKSIKYAIAKLQEEDA